MKARVKATGEIVKNGSKVESRDSFRGYLGS